MGDSTSYIEPELDLLPHSIVPIKKDVIANYQVDMSEIYITKNGEYVILEPEISQNVVPIYENLYHNVFYIFQKNPKLAKQDKVERIKEAIIHEAKETASLDIINPEFTKIEYFLKRNLVGYKKLDVLLRDPHLEDIICTGPDNNLAVVHRDFSEFEFLSTNISFSTEKLDDMLRWILQNLKQSISPSHQMPLIYTSMRENHRLTVAWGTSIHKSGSAFYIRKFPEVPYTIIDLLEKGMISELMAAWIWVMNDAKAFSIIYGQVATGKTTLINSLMCLSNPASHPITVEDTQELQLPHKLSDSYVTRISAVSDDANNDVDMISLVKLALRAKPTYIIIGEVRGEEARFAFRAGLSGHGGSFSFHAESNEATLSALVSDTHKVSMGQLRFLWYMINPLKVRMSQNKVKRKIGSITEVYPKVSSSVKRIEISDEVGMEKIFEYSRTDDTFYPKTITSLLKTKKNRRLKEAFNVLGIEDPESDFAKRISIIRKCRTQNVKSPTDVMDIIGTYYYTNS